MKIRRRMTILLKKKYRALETSLQSGIQRIGLKQDHRGPSWMLIHFQGFRPCLLLLWQLAFLACCMIAENGSEKQSELPVIKEFGRKQSDLAT